MSDEQKASGIQEQQDELQEKREDMTYEEYLKLTNPDLDDETIQSMIRKENRYTWMVRFEALALLVFIIVIICIVNFT